MNRDILWVASRNLRPVWCGRTKPLTEYEAALLRFAVREDGHVTWKAAYTAMGESRALSSLNSLIKAGGLARARYGIYAITEKGRIAIALYDAREARKP